MPKPDFTLKFIKDADELQRLSHVLVTLPAFALDIETTEWWNRHRERIALIQIAFRAKDRIKVFIIDALADFDPELLRLPLEKSAVVKIIHHAAFDATRLHKHYNFSPDPVFDTMLAARRSGERKYSLKAQAETHLSLRLDKSAKTSDWSRRPLSAGQLYYAAVDAYAALLLYENQTNRGLPGGDQRKPLDNRQVELPLDDFPGVNTVQTQAIESRETVSEKDLSDISLALLGIVAELPTRYSPDALAVSAGSERVGMAGWIIDRRLGAQADLDEETIKLAIADLCARQFVQINETRRLIATDEGKSRWRKVKND